MLLSFTDANNGQSFALNPKYVVGVFVGIEDQNKDKTLIALSTGTVVVKEAYLDVVGRIQGELR